jgi:hypothetical protein
MSQPIEREICIRNSIIVSISLGFLAGLSLTGMVAPAYSATLAESYSYSSISTTVNQTIINHLGPRNGEKVFLFVGDKLVPLRSIIRDNIMKIAYDPMSKVTSRYDLDRLVAIQAQLYKPFVEDDRWPTIDRKALPLLNNMINTRSLSLLNDKDYDINALKAESQINKALEESFKLQVNETVRLYCPTNPENCQIGGDILFIDLKALARIRAALCPLWPIC